MTIQKCLAGASNNLRFEALTKTTSREKCINSKTSCIAALAPNIDGTAASSESPSGDFDHIAEKDF
ncbi:MAG: hypothetical protein V1897_09275, partial [Pseudomonadota bacterium]